MTSSRRVAASLLFALVTLGAAAHAAGPSAQDLETARVLYKEGKDLHAKGDTKGAYQKLLAAHSLGHTPLTGIELARVEVELGMLVEARDVCLGIARMPVESDESKRSADAREEAAKLAEAVRPRIGAVVLKLSPAQTKAELTVEVDGVRVPEAALNEPRRVNPGAHDVRAQYEGGEPVTVHVTVGEAESKDVALAPVPPKVVVVPPPPPPPGPTPKPPRTGLAPLTVAGFITAGVGLALGGSAGIAAMVYKSNLSCPNNVCSGADIQRLDDANAAANVSNVGFIVAGIGAVLTVVGFLTTPARTTMGQRSITPDVGLGWAGVHGTF